MSRYIMEIVFMTENKPAKKKILIVDDEPGLVTYIETLLQDNGYETVSAPDGEIGFEKLKNERPDLVALDISMPKKSGIRFYRDLKEDPELAKIPVVIVTTMGHEVKSTIVDQGYDILAELEKYQWADAVFI